MRVYESITLTAVIPSPIVAKPRPSKELVTNNRFGIELEFENVHDQDLKQGWEVKRDGSLRNDGTEFVLKKPLGGASLVKAIKAAGEFFEHYDHTNMTWRCSTHIHMDVRDMEVAALKKLLLLYIVYEKVLFNVESSNRMYNHFCQTYFNSIAFLQKLRAYWNYSEGRFIHRLRSISSKYSALNLASMYTLGSVELRIHNALNKADDIIDAVNHIGILYEFAVEHANLSDLDFLQLVKDTKCLIHCTDKDSDDYNFIDAYFVAYRGQTCVE